MQLRRVPLDPRRKRGACRLCGVVTRLTLTHVPSKSAGNVGTRQAPMIEIDDAGRRTYGLGREALGGMADYWYCATCNNERTRRWDEEYARWVPGLFAALHNEENEGNTVSASAVDLDVGAFVRCLWAWFFAVADGLRERIPEVAAAVREGEPVEPPDAARLYLAATRDLQFAMLMGRLSGGITAPPYVTLLAGRRTHDLARGWFDTSRWLRAQPGARRAVTLTLPIVETIDAQGLPLIGRPVFD